MDRKREGPPRIEAVTVLAGNDVTEVSAVATDQIGASAPVDAERGAKAGVVSVVSVVSEATGRGAARKRPGRCVLSRLSR